MANVDLVPIGDPKPVPGRLREARLMRLQEIATSNLIEGRCDFAVLGQEQHLRSGRMPLGPADGAVLTHQHDGVVLRQQSQPPSSQGRQSRLWTVGHDRTC